MNGGHLENAGGCRRGDPRPEFSPRRRQHLTTQRHRISNGRAPIRRFVRPDISPVDNTVRRTLAYARTHASVRGSQYEAGAACGPLAAAVRGDVRPNRRRKACLGGWRAAEAVRGQAHERNQRLTCPTSHVEPGRPGRTRARPGRRPRWRSASRGGGQLRAVAVSFARWRGSARFESIRCSAGGSIVIGWSSARERCSMTASTASASPSLAGRAGSRRGRRP